MLYVCYYDSLIITVFQKSTPSSHSRRYSLYQQPPLLPQPAASLPCCLSQLPASPAAVLRPPLIWDQWPNDLLPPPEDCGPVPAVPAPPSAAVHVPHQQGPAEPLGPQQLLPLLLCPGVGGGGGGGRGGKGREGEGRGGEGRHVDQNFREKRSSHTHCEN